MLVVVNPYANGGRAARRWPAVCAALRRLRPDAELATASDAAESEEVVRAGMGSGHDAIVVAGGDGSVNLALNVLMDPATDQPRLPQIALGALGLGSSNDFHKPFDTGRTLAGVPARIDVGRARMVDVGRATIELVDGRQTVRYFLLNASMGLVADGNELFNTGGALVDWLKPRNVDLCIALCAVRVLAARRIPRLAISSDDWRHEGNVANVGVLKSVYFAGGMHYDTGVVDDDGQFDVNIWCEGGRIAICRMILGLYRGKFRTSKLAVSHRTSSVALHPSAPCPLELDGEIVSVRTARFDVLPSTLKVCA
jgi:diacylglycerol kinase (ATP)